jgi:hypothetical protein
MVYTHSMSKVYVRFVLGSDLSQNLQRCALTRWKGYQALGLTPHQWLASTRFPVSYDGGLELADDCQHQRD